MSTILETVADQLAQDALDAVEKTGEDDIVDKVSKSIGVMSPTFQEAFNTAVRVRRAERRGRATLEALMAGKS